MTYFTVTKKDYYKSKYPIRNSNDSNDKDKDEEGVSNFYAKDTTFLSSESESDLSNEEIGAMFCHLAVYVRIIMTKRKSFLCMQIRRKNPHT